MASLVFDVGGLRYKAGGLPPPLTSPAPTSLVCPPSASGSGSGSQHGSFPSLPFVYKSIVFPLFGSTDN